MTVKTRKLKNYTSILLEEITEKAFIEASELYDSLKGHAVMKPTTTAWIEFVTSNETLLDEVKAGEEYNILGTVYKIIRNRDYNRTGANEWYAIVEYFDKDINETVQFGVLQTNNLASAVHEKSFKNLTGKLLYF